MELFGEDWKRSVPLLKEEVVTLNKLLYRNNNQHRSSLAFIQAIIPLHRCIKQLSVERLMPLSSSFIDSNVNLGLTTSKKVQDLILRGKLTVVCLNTLTLASHYCCKAGKLLSNDIRRRSFIPLYSVFLAVIARIFSCVKTLSLSLNQSYLTIVDHIKHIICTQPSKFGGVLQKSLMNELSLSKPCIAELNRLAAVDENSDKLKESSSSKEESNTAINSIDQTMNTADSGRHETSKRTRDEFVDCDIDDDLPQFAEANKPATQAILVEHPNHQNKINEEEKTKRKKKKMKKDKEKDEIDQIFASLLN